MNSDVKHDSPPNPARRFVILGALALVLGLGYALILSRTNGVAGAGDQGVLNLPTESKDGFNDIRPFSLSERSGKTITRDDLLGQPFVAGFVFTRCTGPCPRISGNMAKLQKMLANEDVRLVTFTVDPEYDTPQVLTEYADRLGADPKRWLFLTGKLAELKEIANKDFMFTLEKDATRPVGESITHRTFLTVVDKRGRVRGYYDGEGDAGVAAAAARAKFLAHEAGP